MTTTTTTTNSKSKSLFDLNPTETIALLRSHNINERVLEALEDGGYNGSDIFGEASADSFIAAAFDTETTQRFRVKLPHINNLRRTWTELLKQQQQTSAEATDDDDDDGDEDEPEVDDAAAPTMQNDGLLSGSRRSRDQGPPMEDEPQQQQQQEQQQQQKPPDCFVIVTRASGASMLIGCTDDMPTTAFKTLVFLTAGVDESDQEFYTLRLGDKKLTSPCSPEATDTTLKEHGIKSGSRLKLVGIEVVITGQTFQLECKPNDTMWSIKKKIADDLGLLPEKQRLFPRMSFLDRGEQYVDYMQLLCASEHSDDKVELRVFPPTEAEAFRLSQIEKLRTFHVVVPPIDRDQKEPFVVICRPEDIVDDVVAALRVLDSNYSRLSLRGEVLPRNSTLLQARITKGTALELPEMFQVFVRNLTGTNLVFWVGPSFTVEDLKCAIAVKDHTPAHVQRLIFSGRYLEEGRTLQHYKIERDSTVHLVLRLRGC